MDLTETLLSMAVGPTGLELALAARKVVSDMINMPRISTSIYF